MQGNPSKKIYFLFHTFELVQSLGKWYQNQTGGSENIYNNLGTETGGLIARRKEGEKNNERMQQLNL